VDDIAIPKGHQGRHDAMDICSYYSDHDTTDFGDSDMKNEWIWDLVGITLMVIIVLWWAS